ncbi:DUF4233 domain-containing protein [Luteipulveratus sp. YIM 133132]|uniref:DUF4233 domain-containing protein n=1 Tax=Luteipulveratus flavus TaxID=3031728 RepID=A0ABT6C8V0_9MICO|nr:MULTISPECIES: DUF4233 domain-containing protein [unclassified Luteipulveratus]MDE9366260.1 DUF4233 domain-containing protein [Luteipulveratus sp. YIM 133132]MDF8265349.1 DUF4233 domain-containing protein [Luteipulveratus sp. YIM 133296]
MIGRLLVYGVGERMTRRFAAVVLAGQAFALFFGSLVAYAISRADGDSAHRTYLVGGCVLAVLCLLTSGALRRPWGVLLGWLLQAATLASAFIVPAMVVVALIFGALWVTALFQGNKMDQLTRDYPGS